MGLRWQETTYRNVNMTDSGALLTLVILQSLGWGFFCSFVSFCQPSFVPRTLTLCQVQLPAFVWPGLSLCLCLSGIWLHFITPLQGWMDYHKMLRRNLIIELASSLTLCGVPSTWLYQTLHSSPQILWRGQLSPINVSSLHCWWDRWKAAGCPGHLGLLLLPINLINSPLAAQQFQSRIRLLELSDSL